MFMISRSARDCGIFLWHGCPGIEPSCRDGGFANPIYWLFALGTLYVQSDRRELLRQLRMQGLVQEWPPAQEGPSNECSQRYSAALRELAKKIDMVVSDSA
jgi:hypothetical protein